MSIRTTLARASWLLLFAVISSAALIRSDAPVSSHRALASDEVDPPGARQGPIVSISGGTDRARSDLLDAVDRFDSAGLALPELTVVISEDEEGCDGHLGRFGSNDDVLEVTICSDLSFVHAHELAHAWIRVNVTPAQQAALLETLDLDVWSGSDVPWNERGSEHAAVVVQQAVDGLALPDTLGPTRLRRLAAYEVLTGKIAPSLVDWMEARSVECDERPTPLSRAVPDRTGTRCDAGAGT